MTKRTPKRKPKRRVVAHKWVEPIQEVARELVWRTPTIDAAKAANWIERGRTIGRLEALGERCARFVADDRMHPEAQFIIGHSDAIALLPILRAEIERLKGAKP